MCAPGFRECPTCGSIIARDPQCEVCIGREAGAQARDIFAAEDWTPAGDVRQSYEDEMLAAEGAGL